MEFEDRDYQLEIDYLTNEEWRHGARDVMVIAPCGSGKTVMFSKKLREEKGASVIIVHRNHLVGQASKTLALNGVRHRVIGSLETQRTCVGLHMADKRIGKNFVDPTALCAVAGVDTLIKMDQKDPWFARVTLVITDEGHHLLRENKWGKARQMFPNARGAAYTATGMRPDGKGLGREADGVIDSIVQVIEMRELIERQYLADYKIYAPPNTFSIEGVGVGPSGELNHDGAVKAVQKANIVGDVVQEYLRIAPGLLGATFAVSVEEAVKITAKFREAGVPAEMITGETHETMRDSIFRRYRDRQVLQLVSVDVLGEGTDVPAMEVVSMARPTASWVTYVQQFCRPLRPFGDKVGIIIDHVRNVESHARTRGLPDTPQRYNLERREKTAKNKPSDAEPMRTCLKCTGSYSIIEHGNPCPYCDGVNEPAGRTSPAQVDGVLHELDPAVLRRLRREADDVMGPAPMQSAARAVAVAAQRNHTEKQSAQNDLRTAMATWGAWRAQIKGDTPDAAQRRFFVRYGIDSLSAAALGTRDARQLWQKIADDLRAQGYDVDGSVINKGIT